MEYRIELAISPCQLHQRNLPDEPGLQFGIAVKYLASDPGFRAASEFRRRPPVVFMLTQRNPVLVFSFSSCLFLVSLSVQF
ncbi:MAG: hypothetical protein ABS69_16530 [Nitrosomonadales bacterium SCN 54-20]|nr:MAG: hypothetical protein ABS69_16530 [Nitrosomonadales bacterium SCN 54-20]